MNVSWPEIVFFLILIAGFVLGRWYWLKRRAQRAEAAAAVQRERVSLASLLQPGERIEYEKTLGPDGEFALTNLRTIQVDGEGEVTEVPLRGLRHIAVRETGSWPSQVWFVTGTTPTGSADIARAKDRQACEEIALHIQTTLLRASSPAPA